MPVTSVSTYARALSARQESAAEAAGNYKNGAAMIVAKGLGLLMGLIGFGIIWLIERNVKVKPKIQEFTQNSTAIYNAIQRRAPGQPVTVQLQDGGTFGILTLTEISSRDGGQSPDIFEQNAYTFVRCSLDEVEMDMPMTSFNDILATIRRDNEQHPEYYRDAGWNVHNRCSNLLPIQSVSQNVSIIPGDAVLMERMRNELFNVEMPKTKEALQKILYDAFQRVTGVPLEENLPDTLNIPALQTEMGGKLGEFISPPVWRTLFENLVTQSNLP